jgi:hypothetical protein
MNPDDLNDGYATKDQYHWVCKACYEDFRGQFRWIVGGD